MADASIDILLRIEDLLSLQLGVIGGRAHNFAQQFQRGVQGINQQMAPLQQQLLGVRAKLNQLSASLRPMRELEHGFRAIVRAGDDVSAAVAKVRQQTAVLDAGVLSLGTSIVDMASTLGRAPIELADVFAVALKAGQRAEGQLEGFVSQAFMLADALGQDAGSMATLNSHTMRWLGTGLPGTSRMNHTMLAVAKSTALAASEMAGLHKQMLEVADLVNKDIRETAVQSLTRVAGAAEDLAVDPGMILSTFKSLTNRFSDESMRLQALMIQYGGVQSAELDKMFSEARYEDLFVALQKAAVDLRSQFGTSAQGLAIYNAEIKTLAEAYGVSEELLRRLGNTSKETLAISLQRIAATERERRLAKDFADTWETIGKQFQLMWRAIGSVFSEIGFNIARIILPWMKALSEQAQRLHKWFSALSPETKKFVAQIAIGVGAVAALVPAFLMFNTALGFMLPLLSSAGGALAFMLTLFKPLTTFGSIFAGIGVTIKAGWGFIAGALGTVFTTLGSLLAIFNPVNLALGLSSLLGGIGSLFGLLKAGLAIATRFMFLSPVGWILMLSMSEDLRGALGEIVGALGHVVKALMPAFQAIMKAVAGIVQALAPLIATVARLAGSLLANLARALVPIIDKVADFVVWITPAIEAVVNVVSGLVQGLAEIGTVLVKTVGHAWNSLAGLINRGIDNVWFNEPWLGIDWRLSDVVGHMPTIAFAKGGIVDKPVMGLIGEAGPEMVLPLRKVPELIVEPLTPFMAPMAAAAQVTKEVHRETVVQSEASEASLQAQERMVMLLGEMLGIMRSQQLRGGGGLSDLMARQGM